MKKILIALCCLNVLYANEAQIALDYAKLESLFNKFTSCSNNNFAACNNALKLTNIKNENEAKKYINDKCKQKNMAACYTISIVADDVYTKYNALRLACQNQFELACTDLVSQFEKNSTKALDILKKQCDNENNLNSCYATAIYYKGFLDLDNALKYSKKACENDFFNSCLLQAKILEDINDKENAYKILEETCYKNYEPACFNAAEINFKNGNFKTSKTFLQYSCKLGNQLACQKLNGL